MEIEKLVTIPKSGRKLRLLRLCRYLFAIALVATCSLGSFVSGQDENAPEPIYQLSTDDIPVLEREPFDRVYLDAESNNAVMDVEPLGFPDHIPPTNKKGNERLYFYLKIATTIKLQVQWKHIVKIETYPQRVLREANKLMEKNDPASIGKAFEHFDYLMKNPEYHNTRGLESAIDEYLYMDAQRLLAKKAWPDAMSVLEELFLRKPNFKGKGGNQSARELLDELFDRSVGELVGKREFRMAERLMVRIELTYGQTFEELLEKWKKEILSAAEVHREAALQAIAANDGRKSHDEVRRMLNVAPYIKGGAALQEEVLSKFPMIFVGVDQSSNAPDPNHTQNWGSRRLGKLFYRSLVEYVGQGEDGGIYRFPQGRLQRSDDWMSIEFIVREMEDRVGLPGVDAHEIGRRLLSLADPSSEAYMPSWAMLVRSVHVSDPQHVRVNFRISHVLPEALLQLPLHPRDPNNLPTPDGIYSVKSRSDKELILAQNVRYQGMDQTVRPEIIEQLFSDPHEMSRALLRGELDVIDRVYPAEIPVLDQEHTVEIVPYRVPTLHMLIPNMENEFMQNPRFRRALLYAIDRRGILFNGVSGGNSLPGFRVISGPFPFGLNIDDPIGYAYNPNVKEANYSPQLAAVLISVAEEEIKNARKNPGGDNEDGTPAANLEPPPQAPVDPSEKLVLKRPKLIIAHPDGVIAASACNLIAQQLKLVSIETELRKLAPGETIPPDRNYHLLYTEIMMEEPLVDARKLLMTSGLLQERDVPASVQHALQALDKATSWTEARIRLHDLHLQCAEQAIVLPLWQVVESFAYRKNLRGISKKSANLYESVNDWRIVPMGSVK